MFKRIKGALVPMGLVLTAGAIYLKRVIIRRAVASQATALVGIVVTNPVPVLMVLSVVTDPLIIRVSYNLTYLFFRGVGSLIFRKKNSIEEVELD